MPDDREDAQIAEAQGWTDSTLLGLTREWLDQGEPEIKQAYVEYLRAVAQHENDEADRLASEEVSARVAKIRAPKWQDEDGWDER